MPISAIRPAKRPALLTVLFSAAAAALPALAADAPYAGTWGTDAAQCKIAQNAEGAPYVITKVGYDQHEAHCTFKSVKPDGSAFKIAAECSVEGDTQPQNFTLSVSGDTLTWTGGPGATKLIRCK